VFFAAYAKIYHRSKKPSNSEVSRMSETFEITINGFYPQGSQDSYSAVKIDTNRGAIACRYYEVEGAKGCAIFVGGAGGGWDSPARDLYGSLCESLSAQGIAALRIRYREANNLIECVLDVLAGTAFLQMEDIEQVALVGHSFGGAVVIGAGAASPMTRTVVALSTQTYGIDPITDLPENSSILLIHGKSDSVLPPRCSEVAYRLAHEPKQIMLLDGVDHGLDEAREPILNTVQDWIVRELSTAG
jgi:alpha/beta superfamily hydrolase